MLSLNGPTPLKALPPTTLHEPEKRKSEQEYPNNARDITVDIRIESASDSSSVDSTGEKTKEKKRDLSHSNEKKISGKKTEKKEKDGTNKGQNSGKGKDKDSTSSSELKKPHTRPESGENDEERLDVEESEINQEEANIGNMLRNLSIGNLTEAIATQKRLKDGLYLLAASINRKLCSRVFLRKSRIEKKPFQFCATHFRSITGAFYSYR